MVDVRNTKFWEYWLAVVLVLGGTASSQAQQQFALIDQDVVLFAGGANMVRLQQAGYLEAMLTKAFPAARPRFRDFAWEADTVFGQGSVIERSRRVDLAAPYPLGPGRAHVCDRHHDLPTCFPRRSSQ